MLELLLLLLVVLVLVLVLVMHVLLLLAAHFHVHILSPTSSSSAPAASAPASPLHAESPRATAADRPAHFAHHSSWRERFRHGANARPAPGSRGTLPLGPRGLAASLLGAVLRQKRVRAQRRVAGGVVEVKVTH